MCECTKKQYWFFPDHVYIFDLFQRRLPLANDLGWLSEDEEEAIVQQWSKWDRKSIQFGKMRCMAQWIKSTHQSWWSVKQPSACNISYIQEMVRYLQGERYYKILEYLGWLKECDVIEIFIVFSLVVKMRDDMTIKIVGKGENSWEIFWLRINIILWYVVRSICYN